MALQQPHKKAIGVQGFFNVLAAKLPSFEYRKEQTDLTLAMAAALRDKKHLVAQAPTGTGKSFAVTGAIISEYLGTGRRAIIATANNSLLEQYASKDLPFLTSLFPALRWARAKGKNNYACVDKGEKLFSQSLQFNATEEMKQLQAWYDTTETGDKEEIDFSVSATNWGKMNADDSCTGKKCPFYNECHYYKAKAEIKKADIIVTNTHLLLLDLLHPELELFPPAHALIFDEAHELEDIAISQLETSLNPNQISGYMTKAQKEYRVDPDFVAGITVPIAALFSAYRSMLEPGEEKKTILPNQALQDLSLQFQEAMRLLATEVKRFQTQPDTRKRKEQENLAARIIDAGTAAMAVVTRDPRKVSWVETTKNDIKVVSCPYRVANTLHKMIFSNTTVPVITLSATLGGNSSGALVTAPNGQLVPAPKFDQFRKRIGMASAAEFDCPSPFNYQKNCLLYLPTPPEDVKSPNDKGYTDWMLNQVIQLVELSRGRAFVLTTSNKALKSITAHLLGCTTLPVKAQGPDMPNSQLIKWFKSTDKSVLVGTASFWQGISIEGDALKLVIIDKIPFLSHAEPIQQAREVWYKSDPNRKSRAFMDLQVYPATIKLNQGVGRLIRTKTDSGVVAILDPRLTKGPGWKNAILASLPKAPRANTIHDPRIANLLR